MNRMDRRVGHRTGTNLSIVFADLVGSTAAVANAATGTVNRVRYQPFGAPRGTQPTLDTDRPYTGQLSDDTGLMFYNARYYDPVLRRFTQPDTLVPSSTNPQDLNRYTYVSNNPIRNSDPSGHAYEEGTGGTSSSYTYRYTRNGTGVACTTSTCSSSLPATNPKATPSKPRVSSTKGPEALRDREDRTQRYRCDGY